MNLGKVIHHNFINNIQLEYVYFYKYLDIIFENILLFNIHIDYKDFPKERYNTYAKSYNSNLYTQYPGATYSGLHLGTMRCL